MYEHYVKDALSFGWQSARLRRIQLVAFLAFLLLILIYGIVLCAHMGPLS